MWKTVKSYFWWTHPRGSFHYDVMVTVLLAFIFISPHFINYRDKPAAQNAQPTKVGSSSTQTEYLVSAAQVDRLLQKAPQSDVSAAVAQAVRPFSGRAALDHYDPLRDPDGNIFAYRVFIRNDVKK